MTYSVLFSNSYVNMWLNCKTTDTVVLNVHPSGPADYIRRFDSIHYIHNSQKQEETCISTSTQIIMAMNDLLLAISTVSVSCCWHNFQVG